MMGITKKILVPALLFCDVLPRVSINLTLDLYELSFLRVCETPLRQFCNRMAYINCVREHI